MTMMPRMQQGTDISVNVSEVREDLNMLAQPGCAAAIWQRKPQPAFQTWIDGLQPKNLPSDRLILMPQKVRTALTELCDVSLTPDGPHRQLLIEDIAALSELFCDLMAAPYLRLRLDRITSNACSKFHIDAVTARLVCTYRGRGTQFGVSTDGLEPKRVMTVPTGNPILMRGTLWSEKNLPSLLHRSPPIEGTGETRLVLVLDPVFDLEEEA